MAAAVRLGKPWLPLSADRVAGVGGQLGVFEIAAADGEVRLIGYAGGRSRFGLRGELDRELEARGEGTCMFRYEITSAYLSRYHELLAVHLRDHGRLPPDNHESPTQVGRIDPA